MLQFVETMYDNDEQARVQIRKEAREELDRITKKIKTNMDVDVPADDSIMAQVIGSIEKEVEAKEMQKWKREHESKGKKESTSPAPERSPSQSFVNFDHNLKLLVRRGKKKERKRILKQLDWFE